MKAVSLPFGCLFALAQLCLAAPPPNDDFENAIELVGDDVTFSGTTVEATYQQMFWTDVMDPARNHPDWYGISDVWWKWTPTQTCEAILLVETCPYDRYYQYYESVDLYTGTNLLNLLRLNTSVLDRYPLRHMHWTATNGTEYLIRVSGWNQFQLRLIVTNRPFFLLQPQSRTICEGQDVVFTGWARGIPPVTYQWQFSGTNLPGETSHFLWIKGATSTNAGEYTIIATSASGTNESKAQLLISEYQSSCAISRISNSVRLTLFGDVGRAHLLESSVDLVNWHSELTTNQLAERRILRKVLVTSNSPTSIDLPLRTTTFYRVQRYAPTNEHCHAVLQQVRNAKVMYALDLNWAIGDTCDSSDLAPYFNIEHAQWPECVVTYSCLGAEPVIYDQSFIVSDAIEEQWDYRLP